MYLPRNRMNLAPDVQPDHSPSRNYKDLLTSSSALTSPEQLYIGSSMSQSLLGNQADDYSTAQISIVERAHGKTIHDIIEDQTHGDKESAMTAQEATLCMLDRIQRNPESLNGLFKQAAELGWHGILLKDVHTKNILIDDHDNLRLVDVIDRALRDRMKPPYQQDLAKQNVSHLKTALIREFISHYDDDNIPDAITNVFENAAKEGAELAAFDPPPKRKKSKAHSNGFTHIDSTSSSAFRIDKDSSAKDLLGALDKLHGAIGAGRGA